MSITLKATKREDLTKSNTKKLRHEGFVPGVVYGKAQDSKNIAVDSIAFYKTIRDEGRNAVLSLEIENESPVNVMLQEYQMDSLKDELIHVDFYAVDMSEEINVEVPIRLEGEETVSKNGGVLQQPKYELQVRGKPGTFPEDIVVDVSSLEIGEGLTVADIPENNDYKILDEQEETIVTVVAPDKVEDTEEASDGGAEPELVDAESEED